jgi:N-acetyl-gamma-glutamyl-phosphate reductase
MKQMHSVGLVGARGHTGAELVRLIEAHPALELAFVSSRELAGKPLREAVAGAQSALRFESLDAQAVADKRADIVVLALPNDASAPYVAALGAGTLVVDLSADHRFDDGWFYGLPELHRERYAGQRRIANPGCYATAMQLAIRPLVELLASPAQCFGVSGYSGAGTTPSDRNDTTKLADNLMPYSLVGHVHEREVTRHLGHPVEFMPHVAPHFRGITMTVNLHLKSRVTVDDVRARYHARYDAEPLVRVVEGAPWVSAIAGKHHAEIGGFTLAADGRRVVAVCTLDNLLKGAATQAVQNINLALGLSETTGIR